DAGELGDQKQGDQKPNRARLCPEPLHASSGRSGVNATFVRSVASVNPRPSCGAWRDKNRHKSAERPAPVGSCVERDRAPSLARLSRLKTPRVGRKTWRRLRDAGGRAVARPFFVRRQSPSFVPSP